MEKLMKYDNVISFSNGNAILMLSQDRAGSARGPNVDYEIADEALTLNKERYDQETSPKNRGNEELWGRSARRPIEWHHGFHYVSSMPHCIEQKWLTDFGKYYEDELGILIFSIWKSPGFATRCCRPLPKMVCYLQWPTLSTTSKT